MNVSMLGVQSLSAGYGQSSILNEVDIAMAPGQAVS